MPQATKPNTTSRPAPVVNDAIPRRQLITITTALAALAGIDTASTGMSALAEGQHPDADLLASLEEFDALERQKVTIYQQISADKEADEAATPLHDRQAELLAEICEMHATTLDGCKARARSLLLWSREAPEFSGGWTDDMRVALTRDLVGPNFMAEIKAFHEADLAHTREAALRARREAESAA